MSPTSYLSFTMFLSGSRILVASHQRFLLTVLPVYRKFHISAAALKLSPFDPNSGVPIQPQAEPTTPSDSPQQDPRLLREDPYFKHLVNVIMRDGKKARAQRIVSDALVYIRTETNSDPLLVLREAIIKASPIVKLYNKKKGSKAVQVPTPLNDRQKAFRAMKWTIEASDKRQDHSFSVRLAQEILAIVNGNSSVLTKREQLHRLAVASRANLPIKW
ncbi:3839_t:CDS:1 [Paraglomus brasilianum]|uniref:3839_t:CDS:1 n=1 Tax=Paraglomus brasilianum TaxID=144538 RepID=A0A9N8WU08_9GLOM|nr:3839_t:CDS:1 [Paraglomus brasilianum]